MNSEIIDIILSPKLIDNYIALGNELKTTANLDFSFPFSSRDFEPLRWQMWFALVVFARKLHSEKTEGLFQDFQIAVDKITDEIVVGDYIRAKNELKELKGQLGMGMFSNVATRKIPINVVSISLFQYKCKGLLMFYEQIRKRTMFLFTSDHLREVSNVMALCALVSYWGRQVSTSDDKYVEALGDLIYEIASPMQDMLLGKNR